MSDNIFPNPVAATPYGSQALVQALVRVGFNQTDHGKTTANMQARW